MAEYLVPFGLAALISFGLPILVGRLSSRAPAPDGLDPGEVLVASTKAGLKIDNAEASGDGYAYLTDRRLVWTPRLGSWHVENARPGTAYTEPVIVEMSEIRRVDARFRWGGSGLIVETNDIHMDLNVEGRGFGSWERHINDTAPGLLPTDQPMARGRRRYAPSQLLATAPEARLFTAVVVIFAAVKILAAVADRYGSELSAELLGMLVTVTVIGLAGLALLKKS